MIIANVRPAYFYFHCVMKMVWWLVIRFLISLSLCVQQVTAKVIVTSQDYICTGDLHHVESQHGIQNPDCDQHWSYQDNSIGTFLDSTPECHNPCKEVSAGIIILTDCVNITLAVICTNEHLENSGTIESRIHFNGKIIPQPLHNYVKRTHTGAYTSLGALIFISCLLCAGRLTHQNRNNKADVTNELNCDMT